MKFSDTDYETLAAQVTIQEGATERQRWDALWEAVDSNRIAYGMFKPYNDEHIDTALRRIAREA